LDGRGDPQDVGEVIVEKLNTWMLEHIVAMQTIARDEEGQDFAEYALIFALVVVIAAVGFTGLGNAIVAQLGVIAGML
jgi:Flp pilus assembly pilin Flp